MKKFLKIFMVAFGVLFSVAAMATGAGLVPPDVLTVIGMGGSGITLAGNVVVADLDTAFGVYINKNSKKIYKLLNAPTESEKYMTTMAKVLTQYQASKAVLTDVVQGFSTTYNDKGQLDVTPIIIQNYRHKINVTITPDEITDSWIGWLADNDKKPSEAPLVQYVINEHLMPKVNENRELKLIGKGDYDAANLDVTGKSMNGFCTILTDLKTAGTSNVNFVALTALTPTNIVAQMEAFVDNIDANYQGVKMPIHIDPALYKMYRRAYRDAYGANTNFKDGDVVDYSNNQLVPLQSMSGTGMFFATPKSNFIRLINRNKGASNIWTQASDYDIKIFADWWEGVGFAIEEAIFAYIPA